MTIFLEDSLVSLPCLQRILLALVFEKDPGPSIRVQGRLHCPNSVLYGVSGHTGIYIFLYSHKEETTLCGLCFCSSACPMQCSGCLSSVRIRIVEQEGHRALLFLVSCPCSWAPPGSSVMLLGNTHGVDVV